MSGQRPFVTMILAGGTGSRMGSTEKHKVCFEILGVPVIIRSLETYNLCGSSLNVVVVGMLAEKVMALINQRFPGVVYAYQEKPLGTGNAAKKGADLLERARFEGDVLVVAGDKVIEPRVVRRLAAQHRSSDADVTILTTQRVPNSTGGMILKSPRGGIVGILETWELQRLLVLDDLNYRLREQPTLTAASIREVVLARLPEKKAASFLAGLWPKVEKGQSLTRVEFEQLFSADERRGILHVGSHSLPANQIQATCDQDNLSVYMFRAPVLYEALHQLKPSRQGQEEYLTDVFHILAGRKPAARLGSCLIQDPLDVMAFNNPKELLAIEEVYRAKEGTVQAAAPAQADTNLAKLSEWHNLLQHPSAQSLRHFRQWYGEEVPWPRYQQLLQAFAQRFGNDPKVAIIRSPGRINLLGRHIDHQGGSVNVMAINREIILAAAPRKDDQVNLSNLDGSSFSEHSFRLSDMIANLDWEDWQRAVDGPRIRRILEEARGEWVNYVKAAMLRLQEQFRDHRLRGMDVMVSGDIPMGAGLSSSSALVVATAEATASFNHLAVSARRLVSLCGEGEWFVGTRGGAADHAAIKLSRRGYVTRVGFFPFRVEASARFFRNHDLLVCNSGIYAGKSAKARHTFNAKVTAYHIGRIYFRLMRPDLAPKITHLRDISCENLGIDQATLYQLISQLPVHLTRQQVQAAFKQVAEEERNSVERLFATHDAPVDGYPVRQVVVFGLSEMARAQKCLELLSENDAGELGKLMSRSHDGDRVSRESSPGRWKRANQKRSENAGRELALPDGTAADLSSLSGAYGCSLPELDRIVDLCLKLPGVKGAQMAGAGLGGCVMALVETEHTDAVKKALAEQAVQAEVFKPIAGACSLLFV
jgi:N-acetylgalactosamine kinase